MREKLIAGEGPVEPLHEHSTSLVRPIQGLRDIFVEQLGNPDFAIEGVVGHPEVSTMEKPQVVETGTSNKPNNPRRNKGRLLSTKTKVLKNQEEPKLLFERIISFIR
ncbi:hypothetical protein QYF36_014423 [Acer negundo]|nr:hypothetical protein QYF36_014423 [Acer negundo]